MSNYNFFLTSDSEEEQDVEPEEENQAPPKKISRNSYTIEKKLEIIQYAHNHSKRAASKKFRVDRSCIIDWSKNEKKLKALHG